ncbi:putative nuclease HARBI1 [Abeliophyllum distichum]|uniref:Nuclease HARBI1 n=1 Tax=Abeliophyllum distichum TaxID=126358 RepID=A0ABD1TI27_9LAMI
MNDQFVFESVRIVDSDDNSFDNDDMDKLEQDIRLWLEYCRAIENIVRYYLQRCQYMEKGINNYVVCLSNLLMQFTIASTPFFMQWLSWGKNNKTQTELQQKSHLGTGHVQASIPTSRTNVKAVLPADERLDFIGLKGYPKQNVLAACDFDLFFTFVLLGKTGNIHDN